MISSREPSIRDSERATKSLMPRALTDKLAELSRQYRLCLCIGSPGYGKTALLDSFQHSYHNPAQPIYRLALKAADRDSQRLRQRLQTLLSQIAATEQTSSLAELFLAAGSSPFTLVIDDYQLVDSPAANALFTQLFEQLGSDSRLIIASRCVPSFHFNKLLLSGEATIIDNEQLRFDRDEAQAFFSRQNLPPLVSPDHISQLIARAEGWPIALTIYAAQLQRRHNNLAALLNNTQSRYFNHYFEEQLQPQLSAHEQLFCEKAALFDQFSASLLQAALPAEDAATTLQQLHKNRIFIEPQANDDSSYRFHPIFRHYLQSRSQHVDREQIRAIFQRASRHAIQTKDFVAAIDFAIKAQDYVTAKRLLSASAQKFIRDDGLLPRLIEWCEHIPLDTNRSSLQLHFWLAWAFAFSNLRDQARQRIAKLKDIIARTGDFNKTERHLLNSKLRSLHIALGIFEDNSQHSFAQTSKWLAAYQDIADPFDISVVAGARFACARIYLQHSEAKKAITLAKTHIPKSNSVYGNMWISVLDGLYEMEFGDHRVAHKILAQAYNRLESEESHISPIRSTAALLLAKTCYEMGDIARAAALLPFGEAHIEKHGLTESAAAGVTLQFRLALEQGFEHARYTLSKAEFLSSYYTPRLNFIVQKLRTELYLRQGDLAMAEQEARLAGVRIEQDQLLIEHSDMPIIWAEKYFLGLFLLVMSGRGQIAMKHIAPLLNDERLQSRSLFYLDVLVLYAALLLRDNQKQLACRQLSKALKLAQEKGLYQIFIDRRELVQPVIHEFIRRRKGEHLLQEDQIIQRLSRHYSDLAPGDSFGRSEAPDLTEREREILLLLPSHLSIQEIADYLFLSKATIKTHLHHIYVKLGVKNRTGAIKTATEHNLLQ